MNPDGTPIVNQPEAPITPPAPDPVPPADLPPAPPPPAPQPGEKTDSALLLRSLQAERDKRRDLERELEALRASGNPDASLSEEGMALKQEIARINARVDQQERKQTLENLQTKHPALKDKSEEFQQFLDDPENKGMSLETAAKAFLVENNLFAAAQPRNGLERPTGGPRTPQSQGMTPEEVQDLRNNNFRKYSQLVREGKIEV